MNSLVKIEPITIAGDNLYKGFQYYWTGWKTYIDCLKITGQWIAIDSVGNRVYSSVPGICSDFVEGYVFNVSTQPYQTYLEVHSNEEIKELEKDKGLELLKQVIDALRDKM